MEYGQQMQQAKENAKLSFYQNPGYQLERRERKSFIIKCSGTELGSGIINAKLREPLVIDRLSDIYLENFTTFHFASITNLPKLSAFVLKIDQFNHQGNSTDQFTFNSLIIPNDHIGNLTGRKIHKGKKLNYVASVNPSTLSKISGTITGLDVNTTMFESGDMLLAEFIIVARD